MAEGPCNMDVDCKAGFTCLPEGDQFMMPGKSVCILADGDSWPSLDSDNVAMGN